MSSRKKPPARIVGPRKGLSRVQREERSLDQLLWLRDNKPQKFDTMMMLLAQLVAESRAS